MQLHDTILSRLPARYSQLREAPELRWLPNRNLRQAVAVLCEQGKATFDASDANDPLFLPADLSQ